MDMELLKEFVKPELFILIPVLYLLGAMIKNTLIIRDKFIPMTLGIAGIVLSILWLLATEGTENIFMLIFVAITQGILTAGASVYANQIVKQAQKEE